MLSKMTQYPPLSPSDLQVVGERVEDGLEHSVVVVKTPFGYKRAAGLLRPEKKANLAAILYIHWYEPEAPDSNRRQFEAEAKEMAQGGAVCLLVETLWSNLDFFIKRTQADDMQNSVEEVVNLRRAMDLLLMQPGVDPERFACVGHDFGGMYGVLAGSIDQRPTHYVVMAAAPHFPDWYLYYPRLEGPDREAFIQQMDEIDPVKHAAKLSPAPVLFLFADADVHVPKPRAELFFEAAAEPKEMRWYAAGHGLNQAAENDRKDWLRHHLKLG